MFLIFLKGGSESYSRLMRNQYSFQLDERLLREKWPHKGQVHLRPAQNRLRLRSAVGGLGRLRRASLQKVRRDSEAVPNLPPQGALQPRLHFGLRRAQTLLRRPFARKPRAPRLPGARLRPRRPLFPEGSGQGSPGFPPGQGQGQAQRANLCEPGRALPREPQARLPELPRVPGRAAGLLCVSAVERRLRRRRCRNN